MADNEQLVTTQQTDLGGETPDQKYQRLYGVQVVATSTATSGQTQPDITGTLQALQAEIASLKTSLATSTTQQTTTKPVAVSKLAWVEKIREGDFDGAQASLREALAADLQPQLDAAKAEAYTQAHTAAQVSVEVDRYLQSVRSANPDILPFERYLQGPVTERIQLAQQAGRIKGSQDFIREYKAAVDSEVANLRTLGLQFRAAGKDEALTRQSDVLRSTALNPQAVQSTQQGQTDSQSNQQGESTDDYFARRRASENRVHGRL